MYIFDHISLNSSYNEKYFRQKFYKKSKHTLFVQYFVTYNRALFDIKWKNILEPVRPRSMRIAY